MKDFVMVVLLNYNQNEYTLKCIESLLESDYDNFKILLVDNGSTKENANELFEKLPKEERLIFKRLEKNRGYSQGTNFGLKEGLKYDPDYFLIMNNDKIIDKFAIKELVKTCKSLNNKVLVTGKVYDYIKPNTLQLVGYKYRNRSFNTFNKMGLNEQDVGQYEKMEERDMIDDIFVLHPVELYKTVGGYTPYLWINGVNVDLAFRAIKVGFRLIYTPHAKLWHKGSVSFGGRNMNPKLAYWNIQSALILRYLFLEKRYFILFYLKTLNSIIRTFFKSIYFKTFKGVDNTKYAKAKYAGLQYFNRWLIKKNHNDGYNPF